MFQEADVPLDLVPAFDHLGLIAMVDELCVAEEVLHRPLLTVQFEAGVNLFMDPAHVELLGCIAEQARHLADAVGFATDVHQGQSVCDHVGSSQERTQRRVVRRGNFFVGIEDQDPVATGVQQGRIAGRTEVVVPGSEMDFGAVVAGDFHGPVGGSGVHQDELIGQAANGFEASVEESLLVLGDEADRQAWG